MIEKENVMEKEIEKYVLSIGGNEQDVEQILDEVRESGYTTMDEVIAHIENYY